MIYSTNESRPVIAYRCFEDMSRAEIESKDGAVVVRFEYRKISEP
jgi:hypothetical protein